MCAYDNTPGHDWHKKKMPANMNCCHSASIIQWAHMSLSSKSCCPSLCVSQMAYVAERLCRDRVAWSGGAPSSSSEVDLEVIEEYLQEHSQEVQPVHTPASHATTTGQQTLTHTHHGIRIIGNKNGVQRQM